MSDSKIVNTLSVQRLLYEQIEKAVVSEKNSTVWLSVYSNLADNLTAYKPTVPNDGTENSIAYTSKRDDKRVKIKTSRFLSKRLDLNTGFISEAGLHKLTDTINAKLFRGNTIELVKGKAITENYKKGVGTTSCMTGGSACCTRLYENNPDRFQQLIMHQNNDSGRAIVHKLDNGSFLLDRIYASSDYVTREMRNYGRKQGWQIRSVIDDFSILVVSGLTYKNGQVPYQDTLKLYRIKDKKLTIFHRRYSRDCIGELGSTSGYLDEDGGYRCRGCENYFNEDDLTYINDDYLCEDCIDEYYTRCEDCEELIRNNVIYHVQDADTEVCDSCLVDNYTQCTVCDDWFDDDWIEIKDTGDCVCQSCAGKQFTQCDNCCEYFSKGYVQIEDIDDCHVCQECADDTYEKCPVCNKYFNELPATGLLKDMDVCKDCGGK